MTEITIKHYNEIYTLQFPSDTDIYELARHFKNIALIMGYQEVTINKIFNEDIN